MATDASTDPALDAAIRAIPSWEGQALEIVPIAEGRTNRNFRVTAGDETFFLRLSEKSTELLGIDRTAEQDSARAAAEAGVGPEVFVYLPDLGCLVTRWIDADPLSEGDLEREEVLAPVVDAIKAIHAGPALSWSFDPFRIVEDYRRISEERGVVVPDAFDGAHEKASRIEAAFASDPMPRPPVPQRPARGELPPPRRPRLGRGPRVRRDGRPVLRPREPLDQQRAVRRRAGTAARVSTSGSRRMPTAPGSS